MMINNCSVEVCKIHHRYEMVIGICSLKLTGNNMTNLNSCNALSRLAATMVVKTIVLSSSGDIVIYDIEVHLKYVGRKKSTKSNCMGKTRASQSRNNDI